jgi:hypothetical protein
MCVSQVCALKHRECPRISLNIILLYLSAYAAYTTKYVLAYHYVCVHILLTTSVLRCVRRGLA